MAELKIYTMIKDTPDVAGAPTRMDIPEFEVEKMKALGWKVESENEESEADAENASESSEDTEDSSVSKKHWKKSKK